MALTAIIGPVELMIMRETVSEADQQSLEVIYRLVISSTIKKKRKLLAYVSKPYVEKLRIVDFDASTGDDEES